MSLVEITALSLAEIVGDFGFKKFANQGGIISLVTGCVGYVFVILFLIVSLQNSTVLMVNTLWDGLSCIIENSCAYIFLGERFEHIFQYIGMLMIISGVFLMKAPLLKTIPFKWPSI